MKYGTRGAMEEEDKRETICMWKRVGRKVGIGKTQSMETWKKKMGKYQDNWKYGKCERYVIGKHQENWKYEKHEFEK